MFEAAHAEFGDLEGMIRQGEFRPLKVWLNEHVHCHGRHYSSDQLAERNTGSGLSSEPLLKYLRGKLTELYDA